MYFKEWLANDIDVKVNDFWWYMPHTIYASECTAVVIDVYKFDALWSKSPDYIPPHGTMNVNGERYKNHMKWIPQSRTYDMPIVSIITEDYFTKKPIPPRVSFRDGRHRFAAFRDMGYKKIGVGIIYEKARILEKICGATKD